MGRRGMYRAWAREINRGASKRRNDKTSFINLYKSEFKKELERRSKLTKEEKKAEDKNNREKLFFSLFMIFIILAITILFILSVGESL